MHRPAVHSLVAVLAPIVFAPIMLAMLAFAAPLAAETANGNRMPCHDAGEIARQLSARYEEAPIAFGLQSNGNLLQIYASSETSTWTVVSTSPSGMSCIVAAGQRWQSLPLAKRDPMA